MTNDQEVSEPLSKRGKPTESDLKSFVVDETLNVLTREKVIIVKGKFSDSVDNAILIFEKTPFPEDKVSFQNSISNDDYGIKNIMVNDIYKTDHISGMPSLNSMKLTTIHPATEKHIKKYMKPRFHIVSETPAIWAKMMPEIMKSNFSTKWIDNLLSGESEKDRLIIHRDATDNGFVLAMDYKWDGVALDDIHCLAIVCDRELRSLRDVSAAHLPLLREIMDKCKSAIEQTYKIPKSQLRLYIHYPPSFYQLHVHVSHIHNTSSGALVDRAHLLSTVIENVELKSDYYQCGTLNVCVNENDSLYEMYVSAQCLE